MWAGSPLREVDMVVTTHGNNPILINISST